MLINDLSAHLEKYQDTIERSLKRVTNSGWLILGGEVLNFEKLFSEYLGVKYCNGVGNGTDAIELALKALGIQIGDKVATASNAGMYTCTALHSIGSLPIFMDVDLTTKLVTLDEVRKAIAQGAKALVVTHLYGQAHLQISEIADCCKSAGVKLIEDCAQAHGAIVQNKRVGSFGDAGCFSFYPTKNLGALGDGGAVVTNNLKVAKRVAQLRQYGWSVKYKVEFAGGRNSRLDEIQAAILADLLPYLDDRNSSRRKIASQYSKFITNQAVSLPSVNGQDYVAHLFVLRTAQRDDLHKHLEENEVESAIHYPIMDHCQPVFGNRFSDVHLPNSIQLSREILTIPCHPEMEPSDVKKVISTINGWIPKCE